MLSIPSFSKLSDLPETISKNWPLAWSVARAANYTLQQRALPLIAYAVNGKKPNRPPNEGEFIKYAYQEIFRLLQEDAENIKNGLYPKSVLKPENPFAHWLRVFDVLKDGISVARRQNAGEHQDLSKDFKEVTEDLPEYYVRNFHFQTDGYFSDHSAEIYEHQVEILFAGTADPMRRLMVSLAKEQIKGDGKGLKFLELGAGTGALTKFMKLAYPKAQITALDPSEAYLKKAREQLADFQGINFVQGFGEDLPFKDETFDFVYSCFLFHELPLPVRKKVMAESMRVLKKKSWLGLIDSLQLKDDSHLDWALTQFPKDFHEPFYTNYIKHPVEDLFAEALPHSAFSKKQGFFSKALLAEKF